MTELEFAIYEACWNGDIDETLRDSMLQVYTEASWTERPLKEFKDKIAGIKSQKPDEFTKDRDVKDFVDKNYDDLMKAANLLEKEPDKMRSVDVKQMTALILECLAWCGSLAFLGSPIGIGVYVASGIILLVHSLVLSYITYFRNSEDMKVRDDLIKIRAALKKVDTKKLKEKDRQKIAKLITAIDDAETETSARVKVSKESVDEYNQMKFAIYEREYSGEISLKRRNSLLNKLDEAYGM